MTPNPKSLIVENQDDSQNYSRLQILSTPAGWYLGTRYCENGYESDQMTPKGGEEPGSRDTSYFSTRDEAAKLLEELKNPETAAVASWNLRTTP